MQIIWNFNLYNIRFGTEVSSVEEEKHMNAKLKEYLKDLVK